ncbi:MAG TPA: hypothetical protein VLL75_00965, partial [Vicinamibacteria bacterium]|nr:hypothetical protein [Vicinamibacteria bacterium]
MRRVLLLCATLLSVLPAPAFPQATATADRPVPVGNDGFEATGTAGLPSGWSLDGTAPDGAVVRRAEGGHGGAASIELGADTAASLVVLSDEVVLQVGRIYRLSAWVRTRDAKADPLARYPTAV